ncbi:MAG: protein translocase subunit SecD [Patescibacteria group bacterium]|nr:protein translocase subunit SecD [Patescibacteria group bacterium]
MLLAATVLLAVVCGVFVYPQGNFAKTYLPWKLGLDLVGGTQLIYQVDMTNVAVTDRDSVMAGLRDVIEKRVNLFGVSEPNVVTLRTGDSYRLLVELAGVKDVHQAIQLIGETPFLMFGEVDDSAAPSAQATTTDIGVRFKPTELNGRYVKDAQLTFDSVTNAPQIALEFTGDGAKLFSDITQRNVGKPLAIFLDGNLLTAPTVREAITSGKAQITGNFTLQEAQQLVQRFNAGALPAPITLVNQQTIGAALGQDSFNKMLQAGLWGTLAVMLFMVLYYHVLGIFAVIALAMYIVFAMAAFKLFSVTMSLAGIAGFILSIGMAVDANVLIFERTKEELKRGLPKMAAIDAGFERAWTSIRDSNFTTILTSIILFYFTSSFVKGFALTLLMGVVISMFSAITVTRTLLKVFMRNPKPKEDK